MASRKQPLSNQPHRHVLKAEPAPLDGILLAQREEQPGCRGLSLAKAPAPEASLRASQVLLLPQLVVRNR